MFHARYGGKSGRKVSLAESSNLVATRTRDARSLERAISSRRGAEALGDCELVVSFPEAGVDVHRVKATKSVKAARDHVRSALKSEEALRFAGRVLVDTQSQHPVLYTENLFVSFDPAASSRKCRSVLSESGLTVKRELPYAPNAYFVGAPEGIGFDVFKVADRLINDDLVELCHPELIREISRRGAFPPQWHLKKTTINGSVVNQHAHIEAAWSFSEGKDIIIAVIDDGVDLGHAEFSGKIVSPRDVTRRSDDPSPGPRDHHGTACAGVACASGVVGASGVAPKSRLMPIRLASGLGSQSEADAFVWAADHGASVISCSWGPNDGDWWNPNDPLHGQFVPLPDSTRLAIDYAINSGRNGKGCVICWAAGNGNESVQNDGYASYDKVISVAACSDRGDKSVYSDFGPSNWCCFPSSNFSDNGSPPPLTPGIWTTDRRGVGGYNQSSSPAGDYTDDFGGTSSACPGAAGVAALVLARNPDLRWDEVKDVLKRCCDRIDEAGGGYDGNGHSVKYGFGRLNGRRAIELATPSASTPTVLHTTVGPIPIRDLKTSKIEVKVSDASPIKAARINVDIQHTFIGDLVLQLIPPKATGVGPIVLHNRSGGSMVNLTRSYDGASTPDLSRLAGISPVGTWTLSVADKAKQDVGRILRFTVELSL